MAQLKNLEIEIYESFLVHYILNTLLKQYEPFKISYNTHKDKWSIIQLMTVCVQEEGRLIMELRESALGNPTSSVCYVSNMVEVSHNIWWIDSGSTIYISNPLQGMINLRKLVGSEQCIYSRNKMRSHVKALEHVN